MFATRYPTLFTLMYLRCQYYATDFSMPNSYFLAPALVRCQSMLGLAVLQHQAAKLTPAQLLAVADGYGHHNLQVFLENSVGLWYFVP